MYLQTRPPNEGMRTRGQSRMDWGDPRRARSSKTLWLRLSPSHSLERAETAYIHIVHSKSNRIRTPFYCPEGSRGVAPERLTQKNVSQTFFDFSAALPAPAPHRHQSTHADRTLSIPSFAFLLASFCSLLVFGRNWLHVDSPIYRISCDPSVSIVSPGVASYKRVRAGFFHLLDYSMV